MQTTRHPPEQSETPTQADDRGTVRDIMTKNPLTLPSTASLTQAARAMRDSNIGMVLVHDSNDHLAGIVTDRDIVVRAVADNQDPNHIPLSRIASKPEFQLGPDASVDRAIKMMSEAKIRRIPVIENDRCIGIVSLGDLAVARDPNSALGRISQAPSNN
jgi:CBS domain-containing protein